MSSPLFKGAHVALVPDASYAHVLRGAIAEARERLWCTQFVIDGRPEFDDDGAIRFLCHALAEARARGVDVRCLVDDLVPRTKPYALNAPAVMFLRARDVPVRVLRDELVLGRKIKRMRRRTLHAKLAIADERIALVGNHNWTPSAFAGTRELSVAVSGRDALVWLAARFDSLWARGQEVSS